MIVLDAELVASLLFGACFFVVVLGPPRAAFIAWVLTASLDLSGAGLDASSSVGTANAIKAIVIPTILILRFREGRGQPGLRVPAAAWALLISYALVASSWSPFQLSGVKVTANLLGIALAMVAFVRAGRLGLFDSRSLVWIVGLTLTIAVFRAAMFSAVEGVGLTARFTSFVHPQIFAPLLVALLGAALWMRSMGALIRTALCVGLFGALFLNGSRTWFFAAVVMVTVYALWSFRQRPAVFAGFALLFGSMLVFMVLVVGLRADQADYVGSTSNRVLDAASYLLGGNRSSAPSVGTFDFRAMMTNAVSTELRGSTPSQVVLGRGSASGGVLGLKYFYRGYFGTGLDPNRIIHNEWIRIFFEWGALGLILFCIAYFGAVRAFVFGRGVIVGEYRPCLVAFFFTVGLALLTENVLTGAGSGAPMALGLLVGMGVPLAGEATETDEATLAPASVTPRPAGAVTI